MGQALKLAGTRLLFVFGVAWVGEPLAAAAAARFREDVGARDLIHCSGAAAVSWSAGRASRRLPPEEVVGKLAGSVAR